MHCINCGAFVASNARFCPECGTPSSADPEATRLATRSKQPLQSTRTDDESDIERVIFTARPTMLFIKIGYIVAALSAIVLTVLLAMLLPSVSFYIWLPIALAILLIPAYHHVKRNMMQYTLTDSKIEIDQGLIARTTRNLPLRNIQDVTVRMSIFQRLLGIGDLIIENASDVGGVTVLKGIDRPRDHADLILRELRRFAR